MERGIIKSYDKGCGTGMINRTSDGEVRFYTESIIGRDRIGLKTGDSVWFEVDNIKNLHVAINIRKV